LAVRQKFLAKTYEELAKGGLSVADCCKRRNAGNSSKCTVFQLLEDKAVTLKADGARTVALVTKIVGNSDIKVKIRRLQHIMIMEKQT